MSEQRYHSTKRAAADGAADTFASGKIALFR
jgi:hypothetical protein